MHTPIASTLHLKYHTANCLALHTIHKCLRFSHIFAHYAILSRAKTLICAMLSFLRQNSDYNFILSKQTDTHTTCLNSIYLHILHVCAVFTYTQKYYIYCNSIYLCTNTTYMYGIYLHINTTCTTVFTCTYTHEYYTHEYSHT